VADDPAAALTALVAASNAAPICEVAVAAAAL
jgi:hypothetical protein